MNYDTLRDGPSLIVDSEKVDFVDNDQSYLVRVTCVHALLSDHIPLSRPGVVAIIRVSVICCYVSCWSAVSSPTLTLIPRGLAAFHGNIVSGDLDAARERPHSGPISSV